MNSKQINFPKTFPVACHTDYVQSGGTFVVIQGMKQDGVQFIPTALEKGARTIVVGENVILDSAIESNILAHKAEVVRVPEPRRALAELSAQAYQSPAKSLKIIAITGTKGKSTTTFLIEHLLKSAGRKTALLSTVKNRIFDQEFSTKLTTQQPDYLNAFFAVCRDAGVEWVVMEVAAQAFSLYRVFGLEFELGIFTNFSREHGEFYPDQEDYFKAKCELLKQLKPGALLLLNADDPKVSELAKQSTKTAHRIGFFSQDHAFICPQLVGSFNAYNISAATAAVRDLGLQEVEIAHGLNTFPGVPGRLDRYPLANGAVAFIDYAHNPASFKAVLGELRLMTNQLIVVFGAGGDRDPVRRPAMGEIAARICDVVIVTSDNPRSEDPEVISAQIVAGVAEEDREKVIVEIDRERAVVMACEMIKNGGIVALLGKGPDEYQIVKGVTTPFSEREILKRFMA